MRWSRALGWLAVAVWLSGCANRAGVEEARLFSASVDDLVVASEPMLARLSGVERRYHLERIAQGEAVFGAAAPGVIENGYVDGFVPQHAILYAQVGDPPYTAALRYSLDTVARFTQTLMAFADGRALESLWAEAARVQSDADRALAALSLAPTGAVFAGAPGAGTALGLIREAAGRALAAGSRQAFRDAVLAQQDDVRRLIDALIASSSQTFDLQTWFLRRDLTRATGDARVTGIAELEAQRRALAEWTMALSQVRAGFDRVVAAIDPDVVPGAARADALDVAAGVRAGTQRLREINLSLGD